MSVSTTSESIKLTIEGSDLVKDLGLAVGLLSREDADPENVYTVSKAWIEDPLAGLANLPGARQQREALVHVLDDAWEGKTVESPLVEKDGKPDENKWLPIPTGKPAESSGEASGESPETTPTGLYLVPEIIDDQVELGLGLHHEAGGETAGLTLAPYAFLPLAAMPFPGGHPFIFGHADYPVPVGCEIAVPGKTVSYGGKEYDGFRVNVDFVVAEPAKTGWSIFLKQASGGYSPFQPNFSDLTAIVNQLLAFDAVKDWLDKPLLKDNPNKVSFGKILVALGLLTHTDASGTTSDQYFLGQLATVADITFPKLAATALQLLDGLQLLKLGEKGKEGLFITSTNNEEGGKDYGFRFVLTEVELGRKKEPDEGGGAAGAEEKTDASEGEEGGTSENKASKFTLQLGKVYEKDAPKMEPGGGEDGGKESETVSTPVILLAAEDEDSNWTNSEEPLGVNLLLVNVAKGEEAERNDPAISFTPRLDLVSVGFDYKSADGEAAIASGGGFSLTGLEPRVFVSLAALPEPSFEFGAAVRVDHIELPLDAAAAGDKGGKNPVAANIVKGKPAEEGEKSEGDTEGNAAKPTPRTRFSFAAGYTPLAKAGTEQHHLNVFLYNAENERTTETIWWKVEKSFGPLTLAKVGISWDNAPRNLGLYLSGGLDTSGLKIELDALSITMPLTHIADTTVGLKGLSLLFKGGPIEISGGFLETKGADGVIQYDGEAEVKAASFGLSAVGSYGAIETEVDGKKQSHASLFVFALLDVPLGGPPVFFVTGLAGGFGYNRDLLMPTLDDLPKFPLVQAAMAGATGGNPFKGGNDPAAALKVLDKYVPAKYGEYWLGVGIRFTSFEVVQSFAMLSVAFGTRTEIDLLGLSAVTMPPALPEGKEAIGFAELALKLTIAPDTGIFGLEAKLTPESYILARACHLTGGFAFYIWSKNNPDSDADGYQAGDFVITLGGYNPHFKKPKFFPNVPLLGFNWRLSDSFTIKGGMYFALTSTAVMAGGNLSAVYDKGAVRAWFEVYADFLLGWKPFYYYIDAGISIGVRVTVHIIVRITITVSLGVDLALWGPKFGGKARIHLWIITFTIHFGSDQPDVQPIGWDEFKQSFLPPAKADEGAKKGGLRAVPHLRLAHLADAPKMIETDTLVTVRPAPSGLIRDLGKDEDNPTNIDWIINPEGAAFITETKIPAMAAGLHTGDGSGGPLATDLVKSHGIEPAAVDVGPSNIAAEYFTSSHQIYLYRLDAHGQPDYGFNFMDHLEVEPVLSNSPRTTWNSAAAMKPSLAQTNANPLNVEGTLTGFVLRGRMLPPDHTMPIDVAALQYEVTPAKHSFSWSDPHVKTVDPDPGTDGTQTMMKTVADPGVSKRRAALLGELAHAGIPVATNVRVKELAASADQVLHHAPTLMEWEPVT